MESFAWAPNSKRMVLVLRDPKPEEMEEAKEKAKDEAAGESGEKSSESKKNKTPWPHRGGPIRVQVG